jgi:hypothetical protein
MILSRRERLLVSSGGIDGPLTRFGGIAGLPIVLDGSARRLKVIRGIVRCRWLAPEQQGFSRRYVAPSESKVFRRPRARRRVRAAVGGA